MTHTQTTSRKLLILLSSPSVRLDVYRKVRQAFKGVTALCAATASEYLIRAGVLSGYRPWTSQLESALKQKGWCPVPTPDSPSTAGRGQGPAPSGSLIELRLCDLCYSIDSIGNGAPDHVFFSSAGWTDRASSPR